MKDPPNISSSDHLPDPHTFLSSPGHPFHFVNTLPDNSYTPPNSRIHHHPALPGHKPLKDGCKHSPSCFSCPLPDCSYPK